MPGSTTDVWAYEFIMPSSIDPTRPEDGRPASKEDLRANLAAAKAELNHGGFAEGYSPTNYTAATTRVSDHLAGIDAALSTAGGASAFTALADTPASYAGQANRYPRVKTDETGLEFVELAAGGDATTTSYTRAGTGATARTVRDKLDEVVSVKDFGAVGDGSTDDTAAFVAARTYAESRIRLAQVDDGNLDRRGSVGIHVPGGAYLITQSNAMMDDDAFAPGLVRGITWYGDGNPTTEIIFRPATLDGRTPDTPFMSNHRWGSGRFKDMQFTCDTPGAWFMHSHRPSEAAISDFIFDGVGWGGAWGGGFYLTGINNNSEWRWDNCTANHFNMGPFLWSMESDQFLNYWFYGMKYWSSNVPMIRMTLGGHVHIFGLDVSDWARNLDALSLSEAFIFELLGFTHARGVPAFSARHVRVEAKHAQGKLLKSQWPHGSVTFHDIDYSSQAGSHTYGDIIDIDFQNQDGALYSFRDSVLAGTVRLRGSTDAYRMHKSQVLFDNCKWWFQDKPSDIVNYTVSTNQGGRPIARFRNCMPLGRTHTLGHMAVWDADIGSRNAASAQGEEKIYTLRGDDTTVPTTFSRRVKFPIGTIITKFSAYGRPGGSAETTPVTYSLKSSEGTPTTIAQVSASNPSTARAYAETPTNLPWFCDTTGTADLDVVAEADVGNAHTDLIFVIRYL